MTVRWPEELRAFFAKGDEHNEIKKALITSPRAGAIYELAKNREKLPLTVQGLSGTLYWFIDGQLEASSENGAAFWKMTEGTHKISVTDEEGNGAEAAFKVTKEKKTEEELPMLEEIKE